MTTAATQTKMISQFLARRCIPSSITAQAEAAEWLKEFGITTPQRNWYEQRGFKEIGSGIDHRYWANPDNDIIIHQRFESGGALRVLTLFASKSDYNAYSAEWRRLTDKDPETGHYRHSYTPGGTSPALSPTPPPHA